MDWYSWLCKTNLEPGLVYEYSLVFSNNELEEEDIAHFDHDFLRSMGIPIAKHRLEILKLTAAAARTTKATRPWLSLRRQPPVVPRLITAVNKTRRFVARCISRFVAAKHDSDDASSPMAIVVVPRPRWSAVAHARGGGMLKRNRRLTAAGVKQGRAMVKKSGEEDDHDASWGSREIKCKTKWESMFQDLKPT